LVLGKKQRKSVLIGEIREIRTSIVSQFFLSKTSLSVLKSIHYMLTARHITKQFSGIKALDNVQLNLPAGKVTAIIGENGAGKSTLMKILSGVYTDYEGTIELNGVVVRFPNTRAAQANGIAMIHQELNLIPNLSIAENIFLGCEIINRFGWLDKAAMYQKVQNLLQKLRLSVDPNTKVKDLKLGQQQLIEIAKALLLDAKVIIMDEPTSAITGAEVDVLFEIIADLKKEGKAIAYISHKLDELFKIAEHYTILRDGKTIESGEMKAMTRDAIVSKMVGRDLVKIDKSNHHIVNDSFLMDYKSASIQFSLKKGEILGIFGLMGAGRTELLEAIFGLNQTKIVQEVWVNGQKQNIHTPIDAIQSGFALVTEDRKKDGIIPELSVKQNISLTTLYNLLTNNILSNLKENNLANHYIESLKIKTASKEQQIKNLSGGNQQKAILAKWLATQPTILLLDEPTRGIDIHAKMEIYKLIQHLADTGLGILMVSSELPEIFAISDRVLVLSDGKLTGDFPIDQATEAILLKAAIA
jgi:ribose transport system ATP-binding protein